MNIFKYEILKSFNKLPTCNTCKYFKLNNSITLLSSDCGFCTYSNRIYYAKSSDKTACKFYVNKFNIK